MEKVFYHDGFNGLYDKRNGKQFKLESHEQAVDLEKSLESLINDAMEDSFQRGFEEGEEEGEGCES
jgi:hypothetical protein